MKLKCLPIALLQKLGLQTIPDPWGKPRQVLAIPYRKADGALHRVVPAARRSNRDAPGVTPLKIPENLCQGS